MKNKTIKEVTHKGDVYQIPFSIQCTVSGLTKVYTSEEYINGKLDRFGGLAKLREVYICRDAKKLRKSGMNDTDIRAKFNNSSASVIEESVAVIPEGAVIETAPEEEVISDKPIAKKDKRGFWRNDKGHLIKKSDLSNYELVQEVA